LKEKCKKLLSKKHLNANITFMTAHSSKGLGYDNVILINMFEEKFGFPSEPSEISKITLDKTSKNARFRQRNRAKWREKRHQSTFSLDIECCQRNVS